MLSFRERWPLAAHFVNCNKNKSVALQALTNLGPAEQPPLAVFPNYTIRYWVDMWSAHRIPQLYKPDRYFFVQVTTQFIRSRG
jgi:hypothetical protein